MQIKKPCKFCNYHVGKHILLGKIETTGKLRVLYQN